MDHIDVGRIEDFNLVDFPALLLSLHRFFACGRPRCQAMRAVASCPCGPITAKTSVLLCQFACQSACQSACQLFLAICFPCTAKHCGASMLEAVECPCEVWAEIQLLHAISFRALCESRAVRPQE